MTTWKEDNHTLTKTFEFDDYMQGITFVNKVADIAMQHDHHPDIHIGYCKVTIETTTHDQGSIITDKDKKLAEAIDGIQI